MIGMEGFIEVKNPVPPDRPGHSQTKETIPAL
jgi:hypothetical protein